MSLSSLAFFIDFSIDVAFASFEKNPLSLLDAIGPSNSITAILLVDDTKFFLFFVSSILFIRAKIMKSYITFPIFYKIFITFDNHFKQSIF